jgi:hypothetical protein
MASASWSMVRGIPNDNSTSVAVTEGTSAPGAGDIEVRVDLTKNFTKNEIEIYLDTIWRFLMDLNNSHSVPL